MSTRKVRMDRNKNPELGVNVDAYHLAEPDGYSWTQTVTDITSKDYEPVVYKPDGTLRVPPVDGGNRQTMAIEALEQQWKAVILAAQSLTVYPKGASRALHAATLSALKSASAYAWTGTTSNAVAKAAETLPADVTMSDFLVSGEPHRSGWWYFNPPLVIPPAATTDPELTINVLDENIIALLWRREVAPDGVGRTWFSAFVNLRDDDRQRTGDPVPMVVWSWKDGQTFAEMRIDALKYFGKLSPGAEAPPLELAAAAAAWLSGFFASGMTWLRQRIVVAEDGQGGRGVRRRLQRQHDLTEMPKVTIVELRRRESSPSTNGTGEPPKWSHRWVVDGHWRNQWYPSRGVHAPKYIEPFVKGPSDKPLLDRVRVYSVNR